MILANFRFLNGDYSIVTSDWPRIYAVKQGVVSVLLSTIDRRWNRAPVRDDERANRVRASDEVNKCARLTAWKARKVQGRNVGNTYLTGPGYQVARQCGIYLDIGSFHVAWPQLLTLAVILNNRVSSTNPRNSAVPLRASDENRVE